MYINYRKFAKQNSESLYITSNVTFGAAKEKVIALSLLRPRVEIEQG